MLNRRTFFKSLASVAVVPVGLVLAGKVSKTVNTHNPITITLPLVEPGRTFTWTGRVNNNWKNPENWC